MVAKLPDKTLGRRMMLRWRDKLAIFEGQSRLDRPNVPITYEQELMKIGDQYALAVWSLQCLYPQHLLPLVQEATCYNSSTLKVP